MAGLTIEKLRSVVRALSEQEARQADQPMLIPVPRALAEEAARQYPGWFEIVETRGAIAMVKGVGGVLGHRGGIRFKQVTVGPTASGPA